MGFARSRNGFPGYGCGSSVRTEGLTDDQGLHWTLSKYLAERAPDVAERIDWLGRQPNSSIPELRRKAFATIVGSRYENFPMVVLEAMAYGCPLAATRTGGIVEIIEDGVNGVLARPGDPGDLAAVILRLLKAPEFAAKLGRRAAEDAARRYHPDSIAQKRHNFIRPCSITGSATRSEAADHRLELTNLGTHHGVTRAKIQVLMRLNL